MKRGAGLKCFAGLDPRGLVSASNSLDPALWNWGILSGYVPSFFVLMADDLAVSFAVMLSLFPILKPLLGNNAKVVHACWPMINVLCHGLERRLMPQCHAASLWRSKRPE